MDEDDRQVMRKDFETEIKPKFIPEEVDHDDDDLNEDNCVTCALPGVSDDSKAGVKKHRITISHNELKGIFVPLFTDIAKLVQKQVDMAQEATKRNVDVCLSSPLMYMIWELILGWFRGLSWSEDSVHHSIWLIGSKTTYGIRLARKSI